MLDTAFFRDIVSTLLLPCFILSILALMSGSKADVFGAFASMLETVITLLLEVGLRLAEMILRNAGPLLCALFQIAQALGKGLMMLAVFLAEALGRVLKKH